MQPLAPGSGEYDPALHGVHGVPPAEYVPALHGAHVLAPDEDPFPAAQGVQDDAPEVAE